MKSIVFVIPYFGKWPVWFDAHLVSIKTNPTIDWLFFTDCIIPNEYPSNCKFIKSSLIEMETLFSEKIGFNIPIKKPYKLCDLKPSYGDVFSEYIEGYDFWGFTDIDIIWGNIRTKEIEYLLENYDLISSRKEVISGHFNLLKNNPTLNKLYQKDELYIKSFSAEKMMRFCEGTFSNIVTDALQDNIIKVYWQKILCNQERGIDSHQEYYLDKWLWKDGEMVELKNGKVVNEVMYLHFINWKKTIKYCEVEYNVHPNKFYISYNVIHYKTHSSIALWLNDFTNIFDGFRVRESKRIYKLQVRSLKKRIVRKLKKELKWKK